MLPNFTTTKWLQFYVKLNILLKQQQFEFIVLYIFFGYNLYYYQLKIVLIAYETVMCSKFILVQIIPIILILMLYNLVQMNLLSQEHFNISIVYKSEIL
jgi:hypothetical protein